MLQFGLALVLSAAAVAGATDIPMVELDGVVHAVSAAHVIHAIEKADAAGAPLLILRIDTPGGLDTSMRQIVERMLASRTPVVAFVAPSGARAASAGFILALCADVAAAAPGTNLGAAHPVSAMGPMDETMAKKAGEDMAAYVRGKAERRGRNVEMAEEAVLKSRSFTEKEALDQHLIDLVAADVADLVRQLDGREVRRFDGSLVRLRLAGSHVVTLKMSWQQRVLDTIARPEVLFLLLLGTLAGIGAEISHPGLLFPGILGTLCLILFLFASQIIPVNAAGILLIVLAVVLFAAEVKVTSYGLLTVGGIVSMILGAMMLVDSPLPEMRVSWLTLLPAVALVAGATVAFLRMVVAAQRRRATTGVEGLLGKRGVVETRLAPEGWVVVMGERWKATAVEPIEVGQRVEVIGVEGLCLRVRKGE
jgi:membrane-bound serine protease (ClpP class)